VGGGFGNPGVHNLLEPATFGVQSCIGYSLQEAMLYQYGRMHLCFDKTELITFLLRFNW
jgi:3-deoxy-D-manno-octulosonic-acid transferase